jgi:threonine dehydratase
MNVPIDFAAIQDAHQRIAPHIHRTPVLRCTALDDLLGTQLYFKCENFQKAGSFKSRGACNAVFSLDDETAVRGVVTHSSGNHAAALARAARERRIPAFVVMPENSNKIKIAAVKSYGGQITFCEPTLQARETMAEEVMQATGVTLIHPYDDPRIIAGQGTAAVEFLEEVPGLDVLITPVGGGGLLSGTLLAAKAIKPDIRVLAAEPAAADDAYRSIRIGSFVPVGQTDTIADGLRTSLGELTWPIIRDLVDDILLASEDGIARAMRMVIERMKILIEPSSAVPIAALLENPQELRGKHVGIILTGGNVDLDSLPSS